MAAPSTTVRSAPAGIRLEDGFSTKIAFEADPDVSFWEIGVQPPGIDGGEAIQTSTMHNIAWRTMAPRALKSLTPCQTTVAYDPNVYNNILDLINVKQSITVHFPDGSTLDFFGFLKSFSPQAATEGNMPTANVDIVPTNTDPDDGTEAAPVLTSVPGT